MKTIVVAGGSGFIGSHLCEYLLKKNNRVICIDNNYSSSKQNIFHLLREKNFVFLRKNIINKIIINEKIDEIYHLASPASPKKYQQDPIFTIKSNIHGSINLLELAKTHNAKILFTSTSEVYGDPLLHPQDENYNGNVNPNGPRACYDESKRLGETIFIEYHKLFKIKIKIVRLFNTYGPKMQKDDGRVISNFITQAINGKPLTIYGNGNQTRSFCYVDDMIDGLVKFMNSSIKHTGPCNIGNPSEFKLTEIVKIISEISNNKINVIKLPLPEDDPKQRKPDINKIMSIINWQPKIQIKEGLTNTYNYFKNVKY